LPIRIAPPRDDNALFAPTVPWITALPAPLAADVSWIQLSLLVAFQLQPASVLSVKLKLPPPAPTVVAPDPSVRLQPLAVATPRCATVATCPAALSEPIRELDAVFAFNL
jgi:hypothetical protein